MHNHTGRLAMRAERASRPIRPAPTLVYYIVALAAVRWRRKGKASAAAKPEGDAKKPLAWGAP